MSNKGSRTPSKNAASHTKNSISPLGNYISPTERHYPHFTTITGRCLARLLSREVLNTLDFEGGTASQRLAGYIHALVSYGWEIEREKFARVVSDCGRRRLRTYKRYWLSGPAIEGQGRKAADFIALVAAFEQREVA